MNMFARLNENPAMTLQDNKETKRYGQTHGRENSIPTTNKVCGGYTYIRAIPGKSATGVWKANQK